MVNALQTDAGARLLLYCRLTSRARSQEGLGHSAHPYLLLLSVGAQFTVEITAPQLYFRTRKGTLNPDAQTIFQTKPLEWDLECIECFSDPSVQPNLKIIILDGVTSVYLP